VYSTQQLVNRSRSVVFSGSSFSSTINADLYDIAEILIIESDTQRACFDNVNGERVIG
jgi:hypothetical protein